MKLVPTASVALLLEDESDLASEPQTLAQDSLALSLSEGTPVELMPFRDLYEEHQVGLRKTLSGIVGREHCDDLIQDVFIKAWRSWNQFRGESQAKTWLHRIAVNAALDFKKKKTPLLLENFDAEMSPSLDPEREKLLGDLIEKGLEVLSHEQRTVFVLYYRSEFSVEEIGETLEIPAGTVKSRLFKARERFVEFLQKNGVQNGI